MSYQKKKCTRPGHLLKGPSRITQPNYEQNFQENADARVSKYESLPECAQKKLCCTNLTNNVIIGKLNNKLEQNDKES